MLETLGFTPPKAEKEKVLNPIRRLQQGGLPLLPSFLSKIPFTGRFTFHQGCLWLYRLCGPIALQ